MNNNTLDIDMNLARAILLLERLRKASNKPHWQEGECIYEALQASVDFITDMRLEHGWLDDYEGFIPAVKKFVGKTEESELEQNQKGQS